MKQTLQKYGTVSRRIRENYCPYPTIYVQTCVTGIGLLAGTHSQTLAAAHKALTLSDLHNLALLLLSLVQPLCAFTL